MAADTEDSVCIIRHMLNEEGFHSRTQTYTTTDPKAQEKQLHNAQNCINKLQNFGILFCRAMKRNLELLECPMIFTIENLWWDLKVVVVCKPKNIIELEATAHGEWSKIP